MTIQHLSRTAAGKSVNNSTHLARAMHTNAKFIPILASERTVP
ncbi:MAG: hypothetical protein JWQ22_999 [Devosia sp.]|nr:hypothetical protein [Devosia sp.]